MNSSSQVIAIVGPTAVGKTSLSIEIALELEAEIVSIDSRLIYRGMDIGTAKPSEKQTERVPHHLIDIADPSEPWSMVRFKSAADGAIQDIIRRNRLPLLVGGTGQYFRAILQGWEPPPMLESSELREELEHFANTNGFEALHARLERIDPVRASQIDPRNVRRVIRALEIFQVTGEPPSELMRKSPPQFSTLIVGLELTRRELYQRIDQRIDWMFEHGLVDEVTRLRDLDLKPSSPAMSAIGYKQTMAYLEGQMTLEEVKTDMKRLTRQFVRRQANWFKKNDPSIHWFESSHENVPVMIDLIQDWLENSHSK